MAEVTVEVGGRNYRLGCDDGEEAHLTALAARVDAEARRLSRSVGQMSEGRLMLMAALMIADKLHDSEEHQTTRELELQEARRALSELSAAKGQLSPEREEEICSEIDRLSERLERLADAANPSPGLPLGGNGTA